MTLGLIALLTHHAIEKIVRVGIEGFAEFGIEVLEALRNDSARSLGIAFVVFVHEIKMPHHDRRFLSEPAEPGRAGLANVVSGFLVGNSIGRRPRHRAGGRCRRNLLDAAVATAHTFEDAEFVAGAKRRNRDAPAQRHASPASATFRLVGFRNVGHRPSPTCFLVTSTRKRLAAGTRSTTLWRIPQGAHAICCAATPEPVVPIPHYPARHGTGGRHDSL